MSDGGEVMQFREEHRFRHLRGGLAGPGPGGRQRVVPRSEAVVDGAPPWAAFVHLCRGRGLAELDGEGLQIVYRLRRWNRALRPGVVEAACSASLHEPKRVRSVLSVYSPCSRYRLHPTGTKDY